MKQIENIVGMGGGGGGDTPVDSPNTLISKSTARVIFLTSDGEVGGLADQSNKLKSVYFNNVPVMNANGTTNFSNISLDERYGLPSQSVMSGYPSASSTYNVGAKVTTGTSVTYTSSTSAPDAMRVTIRFPALFAQQTNGDTTGTSVSFEIHRRLGAGAFSLVKTITKNDKCTSPADCDYMIDRPSGTGTWSIKVVRITADNSAMTLANDIYLQAVAEIQLVSKSYNNRAVIGLTVTAEATGSSYPLVAMDSYGIKVKVPSNYTVSTRSYSGTWDGTFKSLPEVCDNPAWVLYDLLTNDSHGMGNVIQASDIDQYSFYDAAVYNDGYVPALVMGSISGTEPRYTFNYQFMTQESAWTTIQNVAATFNAVVYTSGNRVKLVQDRPTGYSRIITNSNVENGLFSYVSSPGDTRSSAAIVYWNNPAENWLSVPCYYEDTAATSRYGLNVNETTGIGITTEGQAMRKAKWVVDTGVNNTDSVTFTVGFANAGFEPGEVFKLMDTDYASVMNEAKVTSWSTSTINLDRAVSVIAGNTFDVVGSDGVTIYNRTVSATATNTFSVSFSGGAISVSVGADVIFTGAISPRLFKVIGVTEASTGKYEVAAVEYDPNKFGRVDNTPTGPTPVYQTPVTIPSAPLNLAFREASTNVNNVIHRSLMISWTRPSQGIVSSYVLRYRRSATSWVEVPLTTSSYELSNVLEGTYEVQVYAVNAVNGVIGPDATGTYTISSAGGGASPLNAPTTLQIIGGGTTFSGMDINFSWVNPSTNSTVAATLKDFDVRFIETTGSTTVRTEYIKSVNAGQTQTFSYTYSMNMADSGPRRNVQVQVRCRDSNNNISNPVTATFNNPAPVAVTGLTTNGGFQGINLKWNTIADNDFAGYLIWRDVASTFTPSAANLIADLDSNAFLSAGLADGTTYYYKVAAYDHFTAESDKANATGLNVSASASGTTSSPNNTNEYKLTGIIWTPNSPSTNYVSWTSCTASKTQGSGLGTTWAVSAGNAAWTSGMLYIYLTEGSSTLSATSTITNAIATNKMIVATYRGGTSLEYGDGNAYMDGGFILAGTIGSSQLVTGSAVITGSAQIANATINDAHITGLLTAAKIDTRGLTIKKADGTLLFDSGGTPTKWTSTYITPDAGWLNSNVTLTGLGAGTFASLSKITSANATTYIDGAAIGTAQVGILTANNIGADTIDASKIAAGTITAAEIAAGTITGDRIATNTITATQIDARGLSIKDANGTVILSAGSVLGSDDSAHMGFNSSYAAWSGASTGTAPDGWTFYGPAGGTIAKTTSNTHNAPHSVRLTTYSDTWAVKGYTYTKPLPAGSYITGTCSMFMVANVGGGKPQFLVRLYTNSSLTQMVDNWVPITDNTVSGWQDMAFTANAIVSGVAKPIYKIEIYLIPSYSVMPGGIPNNGTMVDYGPFNFTVNQQINSSNASTFIADLAVNTLQIAGNAITFPVSVKTTSDIVCNRYSTTVILDCYVDVQGAPIWICAMGAAPLVSGGGSGVSFTLYPKVSIWVDGVQQIETNLEGPFAISTSVSGGGNRHIELRGISQYIDGITGTGTSIVKSGASLFAIGTKR
jgi:predicted phage tail protein